ncbi:ABC transporter substrate-binding protein [Ursidibacter maritimus]|uniref:ABC transporter substrate-binding protein n=1 Tax=Ursidibacter maritimus TaxID=1331689 RepID=A0A949WEX0_9PAST|nr:Fe(3+) dicitrate ABC transporter substrate-binding protein [Ursidibacter maritimus]KAE9541911.1 iron-dicitrate transporter substrate-binding subunit [Ursidibacter maritimus]MBV6523289.1 ABC transporter substrate-binding protein [Ursidibacter maritimus]MBV6525745.1 ABC transporter substrate-binding protein [Ursidibacter maritimus]MBV6527359.1 ABC transporter substrate-binding protein [Ursidibacter maritimus]MBV6530256.1 ABC transporter substrate-binding protein [Ursidibacter maritimus]
MKKLFNTAVALSLFATTQFVNAVTVKDRKGDFTLDTVPQRVVALEYSYVDALAQIGVSPVGVADDNDKTRILQQVRDKVQPWESVGTRSQPSLEAIAALKPDLIIADDNRHSAVYEELKKIAPTVVFNSRNENYTENLETAQKIGDLLGKSNEMKERITKHEQYISDIAKSLPKGKKAIIGISRETQFNLYNNESYAGGLIEKLGFEMPKAASDNKPNSVVGLEQVVAEKPEFMILTHYRDESIAKKWENEALWKAIPAVKNNQIMIVDGNLLSRARGIEAAEIIAKEVQGFVSKSTK